MATLAELVDRMVLIENHATQGLRTVHSGFQAIDYLPEVVDDAIDYPVAFRLPPRGRPSDRFSRDGQKRAWEIWTFTIEWVCLVAQRSNTPSVIVNKTEPWIYPVYDLYAKYHSLQHPDTSVPLDGVITTVGGDFRVGNWRFSDTEHAGIIVPFEIDVRRLRPVA